MRQDSCCFAWQHLGSKLRLTVASFAAHLNYVPLSAGPGGLKAAVEAAELFAGAESRRLHYPSVPPGAALSAVRLLGEAGPVERARIAMEKPFGRRPAEGHLTITEPSQTKSRSGNTVVPRRRTWPATYKAQVAASGESV